MSVGINRGQKGPEISRSGITSSCEPSDMGAGNQSRVLCKSSVCSLAAQPFLEAQAFYSLYYVTLPHF